MMKATGMVRRIDDLGRVVVPKEIRQVLRMREGDPVEIYVESAGKVVLRKFSDLEHTREQVRNLADVTSRVTGNLVVIADLNAVVVVSGKPGALLPPIMPQAGPGLVRAFETRRPRLQETRELFAGWEPPGGLAAVAPIVRENGDLVGAVVLCRVDPAPGEADVRTAALLAEILARQIGF